MKQERLELLRARKFTVERRQYDVPGHGPVQRELVVHPGAVLILPLLADGRVVMIRNYRFSVDQWLLELPAGTLEAAEQPIRCAARELEEETGYLAEELTPLCRFYTTPGFTNELMHVFVATGLTHKGQNCEAEEQIRIEVMPLDDALEACADGRIVDGKTIAALQVYHYQQNKQP
ncbi:MAG: NUDIX hydrolase [Planctomycetes bacterium]|nr:NUDIX hydrolase [Planctomycetota bacterium]